VTNEEWPAFIFLCNGKGFFHVLQLVALFAVWRLRTDLIDGLLVSDHSAWVLGFVIEKLVLYAPQLINAKALPSSLLNPSIFTAASEAALGRGRFGSAGSRSPEQAAAARAATERLLGSLPASALQIWTDGSSLGQPGPSGAGAIVCPPTGPKIACSTALGWGTNNLGEVWAIGLGLRQASSICNLNPAIDQIHVFSDSEYAIGVCSKGWCSKEHHTLVSAIRQISRQLMLPISYHKAAAHAGITLNDEADVAAKRGALASKALDPARTDTDLKAAFLINNFDAFRI